MTDPIELLRKISDSRILFRHDLELDAEVANFLSAQPQPEQGMVMAQIKAEIERAREIHPDWPSDVLHAAAIVSEESGELMRAAVQHRGEGGTLEACDEEAIQTAAVAIRFVERK